MNLLFIKKLIKNRIRIYYNNTLKMDEIWKPIVFDGMSAVAIPLILFLLF